MTEFFDLIVVGGGPGGSTVATFVAMQGYRVLQLERESLPLYKIGESLLPSTINGICPMLGVSDEIDACNFPLKRGGTFRWGRDKNPWTFEFALSGQMPGRTAFAYQVERMKFDSILLNNARRKGVDVREHCAAIDILVDDNERVSGIMYRDSAGERREARSQFVVDASGWTTVLGRHVGTRVYSQFFRNVAVFGYFLNGKRLPPPASGNVLSAAFDRGWFWYIPLSDTLTSVGAVIGQEFAHILDAGPVEALLSLIPSCDLIDDMLRDATRVTSGPYGKVRVRKEYSYSQTQFWRPGMALVGDAACFIDPVFSSGVHLSTYSALQAARSINTCLKGSMEERLAFSEFERRFRREFGYFYDFLISFYNLEQDRDAYFWTARKILASPEVGNEAFLRLVSGISGSERLFESQEAYLRHRTELAEHMFPQASSGASAATEHPASETTEFMSNLMTELTQMQSQAIRKERRVRELPLFSDGLVPSSDGFHWMVPKRSALFVGASAGS
jgi:FAD-dependent halogenase